MSNPERSIESKIAEQFRKYYFLGCVVCSILLELNGAACFFDTVSVPIAFAGMAVLIVIVPSSMIALIHFSRTYRRIELISPTLLFLDLGFSFFLCSGNPKDWRAISRFVSMAIYGAFNFWLYVRANKKKGDVPDG